MKVDLLDFDKKVLDSISLRSDIFALDPRVDIIKRVVDWQRLKRMSGTHSTKTVSEVSGSTRKPFKQKGTGNARQGSTRSLHMRGGGVSLHAPVVRSHAIKLQKKVRILGLKHALSMHASSKSLYVIDSFNIKEPKTKILVDKLKNFGNGKFLLIDGKAVNDNLHLSSRGAKYVKSLPAVGANVYDIINSDFILLSKEGLSLIDKRLG